MKVYHKGLGDSFFIKSESEIFLSIESNNHAVGLLGRPHDFNFNVIKTKLEKLDFNLQKINKIKLICNDSDKEKLSDFLSHFSDLKFVSRDHGFELYFLPLSNTIRLAKTEEGTKVSPNVQKTVEVESKKVRVLIIDDSKTICRFLDKIISEDKRLEVVGIVNDPLLAEDEILKTKPDVITLDIHMPNMNGVELIKRVHPKYKIPTIMISSISIQEGPLVMEALENGAVDYIQKPEVTNISHVSAEINQKIVQASKVQKSAQKTSKVSTNLGILKYTSLNDKLIVIGSSTGGTRALREILVRLPKEIPPILIVQHIPEVFSRAFAERLNEQCPFEVKEAEEGDIVMPNRVLIAQGGKHMRVKKVGQDYKIEITEDEPVNRFRPSVDYLFNHTSKVVDDKKILAVILTGMGNDGALGMKELKDKKKAFTIAQDENSSVVFGMPKEAIKLGSVDRILDLDDIASNMVTIYN